ncbi:related to COX15 - cytochrome oxidase assembly factor [Moesziomyces antarcticus]|nr:related to COX15 - cytochrome oxidase assembly factor [Moesziomyces antarcticus]
MAAHMVPRLGIRLASPALVSHTSRPLAAVFQRSFVALAQRSSVPSLANASPLCSASTTTPTLLSTPRPGSLHAAPLSRSVILTALARHQSTAAATPADYASTSSADSTSSSTHTASAAPAVSKPVVALHLYALAFLVYAIVVVGGLTRLTESGLSITEWNPGFKGMRLPITTPEWEAEWDKYKQTPEFHLLNSKMSLDDFKAIYMWEWGHRVLGRVIGVAFVLPAAYFVTRRWVAPGTRWKLAAIAAGIGFQGFLGWFMVKSGLTAPEPSGRAKTVHVEGGEVPTSAAQTSTAAADWTPRVSHFRLAMHMGTAFLVYLAMLHTGLAVQRDYNAANLTGAVSGVRARTQAALTQLANTLNHPLLRTHSRLTKAVAALVFTTAMSGALVAGLDAGLVYNEFPTMGEGRIAPPMHELMDDRYAQRDDGSDKVWRNLAQNPVTVQLIHRTLAVTTACTVLALAWKTHRLARAYTAAARVASTPVLPALPPRVVQLANASVAVVAAQVTLGISTLIYMVPIPLASAHQAGSLALLSVLVALISALRPIPTRILAPAATRNTRVLRKVAHPTPALKP